MRDHATRMSRYREVWKLYQENPPQGLHSQIDDELTRLECRLLDHPPPGQRRGLIESVGEPIIRAPSLDDVFGVIDESDWPDAIADRDAARLRPFCWMSLSQGSVGSCASEGIGGAVMCRREVAGRPQVALNPYAVYGRVNGGSDRGSTLDANLDYMLRYGMPSQDVWPRSKGWRAKLSEEAVENAKRHKVLEVARIRNKTEFGSALIYGLPVYFGYSGHAIFAADPIDRSRFRYKNSWGNWGDDGFGTLSYNSIMWSYGAWAILSVTAPDDEVTNVYATAV